MVGTLSILRVPGIYLVLIMYILSIYSGIE